MACTYRMKDAAGAWQTITGKPAMMAALADGRLDHLFPGGMMAAPAASQANPKGDDYGANNTLVTKERAAELAKLDAATADNPTPTGGSSSAPLFENYGDTLAWMEERAKALGISKRAFSATDEYKAIYPQIKALYDADKADSNQRRMQQLQEAGVQIGDRVHTFVGGI